MYNEKDVIIETLTKIEKYLKENKYNYEIIVVDDCSDDNCYYKVIGYISAIGLSKDKNKKVKLFSNTRNKGKGFSVTRGLMLTEGDYILVSDCDLSAPISQVMKLLKYTKNNDLIVGSRYLKTSNIKKRQSKLRILYSTVFNLLVDILFNLQVKDTQCGFKLYTRKLANIIPNFSNIKRYSFDVEHFVICKENGLNYKEVGINWSDTKRQKVKPKQIINMFVDLLRIKKIKKLGGYKKCL